MKRVARARNVATENEEAMYHGIRLSLILNGYLIIRMRSQARQLLSMTVANSSHTLNMFIEMFSVHKAAY